MNRPFYDPRSGWKGGVVCGLLLALAILIYSQSGVSS